MDTAAIHGCIFDTPNKENIINFENENKKETENKNQF